MAICTQAGGNIETQAGCWILEQAAISQGCKFTGAAPPGGKHYYNRPQEQLENKTPKILAAIAAVMVIEDGNV